ncbi:MAG: polysaccharide pyruvyl transferase family protein [Candidatus Muiribacteriota bacterium]
MANNKTGIITFHNGYNPGAVLQCYAIQKSVEKLNFEPTIIDFRMLKILKFNTYNPLFKGLSFKQRLNKIFNYRINKKKYFFYENFIKNYLKTTNIKYFSLEDLNNNPPIFDYYIAGSDQVWNTVITEENSPAYFLNFVKNFNSSIKISYAASFGRYDLDEITKIKFKSLIKNFNYISVREKSGFFLLKELGFDSETVLDPVFLMSPQDWDLLTNNEYVKDNYILFYMTEKNDLLFKILNFFTKKFNLKVVNLNKTIYPPEYFPSLIKNSTLIITNSFHATAFSTIFSKPFVTVKHSVSNSRIENLLELTNQKYRQIDNINNISNTEIDALTIYDSSIYQDYLIPEIRKSFEFLKKALKV